jgi:hypothetical protein
MCYVQRVNGDQARRVASALAAAPAMTFDPKVAVAYAQLGDQARRWFARVTSEVRRPVRVAFTRCRAPYRDAGELSQSVRSDGVLELFPSVYDRDRRHPLLEHRTIGDAHDCLRAVHDIVSHGWLQLSFDRDGEFSAWQAEHGMYSGLARWALATELHAQHSALWTSGRLAEYKAALLPLDLLYASLRP